MIALIFNELSYILYIVLIVFQNNWECYAGGAIIVARGFVFR